MQELNYTLAHGSKNLFVTIDAVAQNIDTNSEDTAEYVRKVCSLFESDGLLFVEQTCDGLYAMNMYNTDGTQAEMCGNGMRIVARYADENYIHSESFTLLSGGRHYPTIRGEATLAVLSSGDSEPIPNYGVEIAVRTSSEEFTLDDSEFVAREICELHPTLRFTYLNLGNPHIVAQVESIDLELLTQLGERVKELPHIFTRGVNVSLMMAMERGKIFVATYERGVGLTPSCGTAMTASSTTAALLGICEWEELIEVRNRGGFVKCRCSRSQSQELTTQLIGNATYVERGRITESIARVVEERFDREVEAWSRVTEE
ncbi:MAG: diaminopimelate epimerase [Rikenellaceae bacterium]